MKRGNKIIKINFFRILILLAMALLIPLFFLSTKNPVEKNSAELGESGLYPDSNRVQRLPPIEAEYSSQNPPQKIEVQEECPCPVYRYLKNEDEPCNIQYTSTKIPIETEFFGYDEQLKKQIENNVMSYLQKYAASQAEIFSEENLGIRLKFHLPAKSSDSSKITSETFTLGKRKNFQFTIITAKDLDLEDALKAAMHKAFLNDRGIPENLDSYKSFREIISSTKITIEDTTYGKEEIYYIKNRLTKDKKDFITDLLLDVAFKGEIDLLRGYKGPLKDIQTADAINSIITQAYPGITPCNRQKHYYSIIYKLINDFGEHKSINEIKSNLKKGGEEYARDELIFQAKNLLFEFLSKEFKIDETGVANILNSIDINNEKWVVGFCGTIVFP